MPLFPSQYVPTEVLIKKVKLDTVFLVLIDDLHILQEAYIQDSGQILIVTAGGDTELVSGIIDGTELTTTTATLNGQQVIILTNGHLTAGQCQYNI